MVQNPWVCQWGNSIFRKNVLLAIAILLLIAICFPMFFSIIQQREGVLLIDKLLHLIPSKDVSSVIFIVLYATITLAVLRMVKSPLMFVTLTWAYIFLCVTRLLTISLVSLNPPDGLIDLIDPFSIIFYHTETITKDLFFSGHVSTMTLIALCLTKKREKLIVFLASGLMAVLVLIQHVHYTLDVAVAPLFSVLFWYMGKSVSRMVWSRRKDSLITY